VRKRRRLSRFTLASGQIVARALGPGGEPRCQAELTEIRAHGQDWWTLGFEATGPADLLRSALEATAALVFAQALPGGLQPGPDDSRSYAEWLCQRPGAGSDADGLWPSSRRVGWSAFCSPRPASAHVCARGKSDYGDAQCQQLAGSSVNNCVTALLLKAMEPAALEVSLAAGASAPATGPHPPLAF